MALVPTMGALHAGHISLVREAKRHADRIVVSIFINPAQFAPGEDFEAYPRNLEADIAKVAAAGGDLVFAPNSGELYPPGFAMKLEIGGPAIAGLEDRFRPTHFSGVATVVAKLFNQCRPDVAVFGEKDYQQLKVIGQMARDLDFETLVIGAPTVRESDGLAMSSRNVFLRPKEREVAPRLYQALARCASEIRDGTLIEKALANARQSVAAAGFVIDYIEALHAETLAPLRAENERPIRLLAAAKIGATRLIDNVPV